MISARPAIFGLAALITPFSTTTAEPVNSPPVVDPSGGTVQTARDCQDCPEMVPVEVTVAGRARRLMVGRFELTWREYLAAVDDTGCPRPRNRSGGHIDFARTAIRDRQPMSSIAPVEIDCYLAWIRQRTGRNYRLPSEAEWEAVARAGSGLASLSTSHVPAEDAFLLNRFLDAAIPIDEDREAVRNRIIHEVGQRRPNRLGLHDLFGNVAEVVSDDVIPISGPNGEIGLILIKGGHQGSDPGFDVIRDHSKVFEHLLNSTVGYRLVYDPVD